MYFFLFHVSLFRKWIRNCEESLLMLTFPFLVFFVTLIFQPSLETNTLEKFNLAYLQLAQLSQILFGVELITYYYRTRAIISHGLYILYPIFKDHFFVFKEVFQKILSLCNAWTVKIGERSGPL